MNNSIKSIEESKVHCLGDFLNNESQISKYFYDGGVDHMSTPIIEDESKQYKKNYLSIEWARKILVAKVIVLSADMPDELNSQIGDCCLAFDKNIILDINGRTEATIPHRIF